MTIARTIPQAAPHSARLVQLVSALGQTATTDSHACFAERLGRLFGLADTMELDSAIGFRAKGPFEADAEKADKLRSDLVTTRSKLMERVRQSFTASPSDTMPSLPPLDQDLEEAGNVPPERAPYLNFYLARQRELAAGTRQLRTRIRTAIATTGPAMAHLAQLDTVFDHTLAGYTSQGFATLPTVLEKRFDALWQSRQQMNFDQQDHDPAHSPAQGWTKPGGWLHQYCNEMQMLLLAELDVRLEPAIGLLEAYTNEVSNTP